MAPYLSLFGLNVQAYPLLILLAAWAGLWLAARQAARTGLDGDHLYNMGFYVLLAALFSARLTYVLTHWSAYRDAPLSALSPTATAFKWPEGALIGGLVALLYGLRYRLPAGATLDAVAPGLALAMAMERLGAFLDGRSYGEPTALPWGVLMWGETRHPVQLYEMVSLLVILGLLLWRGGRQSYPGQSFSLFVAWYAASRLFLEAFRADVALISRGLRSAQVVALMILLAAVWYMYRRHFATSRESAPAETPEGS